MGMRWHALSQLARVARPCGGIALASCADREQPSSSTLALPEVREALFQHDLGLQHLGSALPSLWFAEVAPRDMDPSYSRGADAKAGGPQNKWMQLTRSAHGQTGRGPRS